jgi:hypothetical protein
MVSPIETAIQKMQEVGFFDILAFLLFLAIFYTLFRKSKVLGESVFINGIAALAISFFIFLYPLLTGFSLVQNLVTFFAQASIWILAFLVAFLLASFFYPDLPKMLATTFTRRTTLFAMVGLGIALLVTSGFISILWKGLLPGGEGSAKPGQAPRDVVILAVGIVVFIILLMVASSIARGGE